MGRRNHLLLLLCFLVVLMCIDAIVAQGNGKGDGNGNGNGKGLGNGKGQGDENGVGHQKGDGNDNGKGKGNGEGDGDDKEKGKGDDDDGKGKGDDEGKGDDNAKGNGNGNNGGKSDATTYYVMLHPDQKTGQGRAQCQAQGRCYDKILQCPAECGVRKPAKNKKVKGCFIDCNKCETTCKYRKPKCEGYGSICYDPRFVGGDGVMFYFHGAKGGNFALVSDNQLQINGHFIGTRPAGRTRDFTWVQALAIMFESHTLVVAAKRVTRWDDNVDCLMVRWDGKDVMIPTDGETEWRVISTGGREVVVERTDETNSAKVTVYGLVEINVKVVPISELENRVHNYQLTADDAFAHLETQFKFAKLTDEVEGVLGKTYQPNYVSPVKIGVPMPMMGGEDKYQTPDFLSPLCRACRFQRSSAEIVAESQDGVAQF